jgi:glycosyltransferase involved in cell wall biosynthesis
MGKAVIAPRTPAVEDVMVDGEDGLLVTPGSREELIQAIVRLAQHPEERTRIATTFQRHVRQRHTWITVAGRVSQLLELSLRSRQLSPAADLPETGKAGGRLGRARAKG